MCSSVLVELWDINILGIQTIKKFWFGGKRNSVKIKLQNKVRVVKSRKHGKRACGTRMRRLRNPERGNSRAKCRDNETINKIASMRFPQCSLTTIWLPINIEATSQQ